MAKLRRVSSLKASTLSNDRPAATVVVEHKVNHDIVPKKLTLADLQARKKPPQPTLPLITPKPESTSDRAKTLMSLGSFSRTNTTPVIKPAVQEPETPRHQCVPVEQPEVTPEVFVKDVLSAPTTIKAAKPKAATRKRTSPTRHPRPEDLVVHIPVSSLAKLFSFATRILFSEGLSAMEEVEFMACVQEFIANAQPIPTKAKGEKTVSYFVDGVSTDVDVSYVLNDLLSKCKVSQKGLAESLSDKLKTLCN